MNSVRAHLYALLLPLYLLTAAITLVTSYRVYNSSINAFMDGQIHSLAITSTRRDDASLPQVRTLNDFQIEHEGAPVLQLWGKDQTLLASSRSIPGVSLQPTDGFHTLRVQGHDWRLYTAHTPNWDLQIAQSADFRHRVIMHSTWRSAAPILLLLPCSIALLWLAVHLALRPVERLIHAVTHQNERTLAPLALSGVPRELVPLVRSVNGLISRLRLAFESQQRFVQDAAHELRTPLMALMLQAENLRDRLGSSAVVELSHLESGIRRLHRLVEQLLELAREQEPPGQTAPATVELLPLLQDVVADLMPLAEQRRIDVGFRLVEPLSVQADGSALRCVFDNLLENALHHSPEGSSVDVSLRCDPDAIRVEFVDNGPGIQAELLERVFDRFFRPANTTAPGTGLGLAIAQAAAVRAGARVALRNRTDRSGLCACVQLPRA